MRPWCLDCSARMVGGEHRHEPGCPSQQLEEPRKRGTLVRDRDGDVWRRGNTRWSCTAPVDGVRVRNVGRLPWSQLLVMYGPLEVLT